ncbi:MAG: TolC family protein [Spirochaetales bacterium]
MRLLFRQWVCRSLFVCTSAFALHAAGPYSGDTDAGSADCEAHGAPQHAAAGLTAGRDEQESPVRVLSIDTAMDRALDVSDDLRFAEREAQLHADRFVRERRTYLPTLSISYASDTAITPLSPDNRSQRLSLGLRQTLYDRGALSRERRRTAAELALRRSEVDELRRDIETEAWETIVQFQLLAQRVRARATAIEVADRALRIAEEQFALGRITERELNESRVSAAELEEQLGSDKIEQTAARFELIRLLRLPPDEMLSICGGFQAESRPKPLDMNASGLFNRASRHDLELRRSRLSVRRATEQAHEVGRRFLPKIDASASISLAADTLPLRDPGVSVAVDFSWSGDTPVSTEVTAATRSNGEVRRGAQVGFEPVQKTTSRLDEAQALLELDRSRASLDEYESELRFALTREISLFELSVDRWRSARRRRDLAETQVEILETEAELGRARPIDVHTAAKSLLEAELNVLEIAFESMTRRRGIEELTGVYSGEL